MLSNIRHIFTRWFDRFVRSAPDNKQGTLNKPLVRIMHHFSCTGGTLFTKCIAAQPNVLLLNEIDPYSKLGLNSKQFNPRSIIDLLHQSGDNIDNALIGKIFCQDIATITDYCVQANKQLVLREHTHSTYLVGNATTPPPPTMTETLSQSFLVKSVITVRNPIDSYLSLKQFGWTHFEPPTFNEYCLRYLRFLHDYPDVKIIRYEDFVQNSQSVMSDLCQHLELDYDPNFINTFGKFKFAGDSGRSGTIIESRPRRPYDKDFSMEVATAEAFVDLCQILGYEKL